jgi:hypothetical protein
MDGCYAFIRLGGSVGVMDGENTMGMQEFWAA